MANELKVSYRSGLVLYALVQSAGGYWFNVTTQLLEPFSAPDWTDYAIALAEQGTSGDYFGDFPSILPSGAYRWEARLRIGGTPAQSDPPLGDVDPYNWFSGITIPGSYTRPSVDQIINRSGINTRMERYVQGDLVTSLTNLIPDAETRTALAVTEAVFASTTLTAYQVLALQIAVSYRVISTFLLRVADQWASGTQAPRERINPEELVTLATNYEDRAVTYDQLVLGVVKEEEPELPTSPLLTGRILTNTPNEYLDSFRPDWRTLEEIVVE